MRDYGMVSPQFWIGSTGKALRGKPSLQVAALYLMTSPHANMIGVYYCPLDYIGKESGLGLEGASEALRSLQEGGFCSFDEQSEEVFVHRMAAFQIGQQLDPKDNRCKGVAKELEKVASAKLRQAFHAMYSGAFHLPGEHPPKVKKTSPSKAPSKPETEAEAEAEEKTGGFDLFWEAWPKSLRKESRGKCAEVWARGGFDAVATEVVAHVERLKASTAWTKSGGEFIPAPLVYLNNRRWEGAEDAAPQSSIGSFI